jgi:hypothetical protein
MGALALTLFAIGAAFALIILIIGYAWYWWLRLSQEVPDECPMHGEPMPCTTCEMMKQDNNFTEG